MESKTPIGAPRLNMSVWQSQASSMDKTEEERDELARDNAQRIFLRNRRLIMDYLLPPESEEQIEYPLHRLASIDVQAEAQYKDRRCRELGGVSAYSAKEFPDKVRDAMVRDVFIFRKTFEGLTTELVRELIAQGRIAPLDPDNVEIEWEEEDWDEEFRQWRALEAVDSGYQETEGEEAYDDEEG